MRGPSSRDGGQSELAYKSVEGPTQALQQGYEPKTLFFVVGQLLSAALAVSKLGNFRMLQL